MHTLNINHFSRLGIFIGLLTKSQKQQRLRYFLLIAVVSACLAQSTLSLSTVSAQKSTSNSPQEDDLVDGNNTELAASYARFSSDNQDATSIVQQHEKNRQAAVRNGHLITKHFEFSDEAISGTTLRRSGLDALIAGAKQGKYRIIYVWSMSRLAREVGISIPLLKELVHVNGIRIISVSEGIDSSQASWELNAIFNSFMAQEYLARLREDVKRGIRYALENHFSVGDRCFGYTTEPDPNHPGTGKNRKARPRMRRVIDPDAAQWVIKIFYWYTVELRSINWIRNELNKMGAPKDIRSSSRKGWLSTCVRNVLANSKYVGIWRYGLTKTITNPLTGVKTQLKRHSDDPEIVTLHFPELRIVDDATFEKARLRLQENEEKVKNYRYKTGKFKGSPRDSQAPRHLLQGLLVCKQCGSKLQMNGLRGLYLQCSAYPRNECKVKTSLLRSFAEREILRVVGQRILEDPTLRRSLLASVKATWERHQSQSPLEKDAINCRRRKIEKKIEQLVDQVEDGNPPPDITARLNARRQEIIEIERKLESLGQTPLKLESPPTEEWVIEQLKKLHQLLISEPALAGVALRKLIGSIEVSEVALPGLVRKKLVGKFKLSARQIISTACDMEESSELPEDDITICLAELPEWAQRADEVKALYDQNLSALVIAEKLGLKFAAIAKALKWWYVQRGLPVPSGSEKRARIIKPTPIQDSVVAVVIKLWQEGMPIHLIAKQVGCSRNTVTVIIKKWHQEQGIPWLNGQARRKQLRLQRESQSDQDAA